MRFSANFWDTLLVASIVLVAGLCSQSQQVAQAEEDAQPEGKIVRIAPDPEVPAAADDTEDAAEGVATDVAPKATPTYWIGIAGRGVESAVLRTQLQLAQDMGIVVEQVVPESPAEKAGLRKHDIILRANGAGVHGMEVLREHVRDHQGKPLELKILRLGKEETLVVVPEARPADLRVPLPRSGQGRPNGFLGGRADLMAKLMEQLQAEGGLPEGMRRIGPRVFLPGMPGEANRLPEGVSISIQREGNGPAEITVRRRDKTWHVVGDDPKSLEQLPEDLRPFVERMLRGNANPGFDWEAELEQMLPNGFGGLQGRRVQRPVVPREREIDQRVERLEQELRSLKKQLAEE